MLQIVVFLVALSAALAVPSPGNIDWRVVGGSTASPGQFPYIISLRTSSNSHTCGGSLIDNNWVLTAAHCVVNGIPSSYSVIAGITQLTSSGVRAGLSEIIVHEGYDDRLLVNDLALLRLSTPIQETDLIKIIKIETSSVDTVRDCTLSGWGRTSYPGNIPNDLQYLPLRTVTQSTCSSSWSSETIVSGQICTFTQSGQGACHGDSGGPLVAEVAGETRQIGLVSWGAPCAVGAPDVYTRVSTYAEWIQRNSGITLS